MKITTLLLITAILHVSATTLAQKVTLNEKNAPLADVFNDISAQTNYDFAFTTDALKNAKLVTINVKNVELSDALTQILQGQNLEFSIDNYTVVIKPKETSALDNLKKQVKDNLAETTVTGKVVDGTGQPMPNVNVKEKGTQNGTVTDSRGKYTLTVASDKSIVVFSYIGYEPQELPAKDIPDGSTITLKAAENNLQEVVISKGYYDEKQELSTGDVSVVTAKTIQEQPVSDPIQALIGRVPGLNIQQASGVPGAYATIQVRGQSSIASGNDPLYIIDGVPFNSASLNANTFILNAVGGNGAGGQYNTGGNGISPFNALNPGDIENIEILKDADATAIYGSRGANGVILITTKKGKAGSSKFDFNASQGIGEVAHFMDLLNTQQYLRMRRQAFANDGLPLPTLASAANDGDFDVDGVWDTTRYTNWQKKLIGGTAQWTNINGTLSGGNANTQFLIGGGYNRQTTVYPGDYEDRKGSVHVSITHTSTNQKFHAQFSASYVNDNDIIPVTDFTQYITLAPDAPALYNPNGSINWQLYNGTSTFNNPLGNALMSSTSATNNLVSNLDLSYLIFPELTFKAGLGYNHDELNENNITPADASPPPYNTDPNSRQYQFGNTISESWIIEPQLSYDKKIAKGKLNVLLGSTFQQSQQQTISENAYGFASDALITDFAAAQNFALNNDYYSLYKYSAVYGRIGYIWEDKYLLNITARRDGSSRFGPNKQFGNFGAVGLGWVFSKEKFIQDNLPWLNFGKLRGSYGVTGNDQIGNYAYLSSYYSSSTTYQGITQLIPAQLPNPNFSWETDKKLEGGLDVGFLKDRVDLSLSYYRQRSSNQLVGYSVPEISGPFGGYEANFPATVQNTGLEATLNTANIKSKDFTWSTNINFTLPENKLLSYPDIQASSYYASFIVGKSIFIKEVYNYTGVNLQTGLYTFATSNGNTSPSIPQNAVSVLPTQKFYGGIQNNFTYKNFGLDLFVQFVKQLGVDYQGYFNFPGLYNFNQPTAVLNAWNSPGQLTNTEMFTTRYQSAAKKDYSLFQNSSGVYTDASFIRIKNVALSYKIPDSWQKWSGMSNAKVFLQGQNLYTFTKYLGLDPETQGLILPPLRMITLGLSASF